MALTYPHESNLIVLAKNEFKHDTNTRQMLTASRGKPDHTVRYKILEGENFGEFGELLQNRQKFLVQNFLF